MFLFLFWSIYDEIIIFTISLFMIDYFRPTIKMWTVALNEVSKCIFGNRRKLINENGIVP